MTDFVSDIMGNIIWRSALIGALIFLVTFIVNLAIVTFILVKLPTDYFKKTERPNFGRARALPFTRQK